MAGHPVVAFPSQTDVQTEGACPSAQETTDDFPLALTDFGWGLQAVSEPKSENPCADHVAAAALPVISHLVAKWSAARAEQEEESVTCGPERRRRSHCVTELLGRIDQNELYHEESSSEQSVDSEVEFHLYSQIHYSQNLGEVSTLEMDEEADVAEVTGRGSGLSEKQGEDEKEGEEFTGGGARLSDDPEVIVLSDTPDEVSIYKSKAKRFRSFSSHDKKHIHPVSSTPSHTKAAGCDALCPPGSDVDTPRQSRNTSGMPSPVGSAGAGAIHEVLAEDSSEEESMISDSDNVESWMLLGAGADDRDGDIILNLEGCAAPAGEG
ncbi:Zinc finger CCHC domain-containing protein 7 [Willisornis vidua]|uniref:Zinc finger CCHC domain-containing protein 7 n=1 Tax=Willisornis vidua TaxID=1566151 RepID=A0ABQ9CNZ9_9PASS|nr:Zinc finger CCHC domain-containing protein 7 [Willisornis vidua]